MKWFKWPVGMSGTPVLYAVSRRSKQPMGFVVAVWAMLLETGCQQGKGSIKNFDSETADALFGMPDGAAAAILKAMQEKGLLTDGLGAGDFILGWNGYSSLPSGSELL